MKFAILMEKDEEVKKAYDSGMKDNFVHFTKFKPEKCLVRNFKDGLTKEGMPFYALEVEGSPLIYLYLRIKMRKHLCFLPFWNDNYLDSYWANTNN